MAIPCPEGTYGNSTRLPSIHQCDKCPPGAWCSGGSLVPCAADTYNGAPGKQSQSACQPCPTLSSTEGNQFSTSLPACKCDVQYYNGNQSGGVECVPCPVGTVCPEPGMMLLTLPIEAGYYRPSDTSTDIRRCPDAIYGCVGNGSECTSACQGGSRAPGCHPTLAGPFCLLCANRTGHYFSSATADESAQCYPCDSLGLTFTLVLSTTVAALFAIGCAFWRMRQLRYMKLTLYKCRDLWFILRSRIKVRCSMCHNSLPARSIAPTTPCKLICSQRCLADFSRLLPSCSQDPLRLQYSSSDLCTRPGQSP